MKNTTRIGIVLVISLAFFAFEIAGLHHLIESRAQTCGTHFMFSWVQDEELGTGRRCCMYICNFRPNYDLTNFIHCFYLVPLPECARVFSYVRCLTSLTPSGPHCQDIVA